jgi:hypothetical protein
MAWVDALSSGLGVGTGGAALAVAIYAGASALEKEMRPEARHEITLFIRNSNITSNAQIVANFVFETFKVLFGKRHLTWKCFWRSAAASLLVSWLMTGLFWLKYPTAVSDRFASMRDTSGDRSAVLFTLALFVLYLVFSCLPDYISLLKGRLILSAMTRKASGIKIAALVLLDLAISIGISSSLIFGALTSMYGAPSATSNLREAFWDCVGMVMGQSLPYPRDIMVVVYVLSTLVTSIWAVMIIVSAGLLKVLASFNYLMRMVRWMFDVDAHPVRVLGLVAAGTTWIGSVVYGAL